MRIELTPGMTNVVRFPIERRAKPSMELVRDIAPDSREVSLVIESFGFDDDIDGIRDAADQDMADDIAQKGARLSSTQRQAELDRLLQPIVERAVSLCRDAHDASLAAVKAQRQVVEAQSEGGYWLTPLSEQASARTFYAARLLVDAHVACQRAAGASRAIEIAKRGETWARFDLHAEAHALCADELAARTSGG
ncbi:hypothetical protein IY145_01405 [Methylosinus sp. H3A]|uniref:hypothetical protein n=1 Tax=unclassified Methylosinus TaxID=2624500 RepID=UPI000466C34D|nr:MULTISPECIES: hypothetical protein [unclassified Methylosinus]MBG0808073.1 hypothetical protein [Methylosinus sp. H3A]